MIMAPPRASVPPAAKPIFGDHFDAWNSSSTGHQRAENRLGGSTGWRQSRSMKLSYQFKGGNSGGQRISDTIGAGSKDWDEKAKAPISKEVLERARISVKDMLLSQDHAIAKHDVRDGIELQTDLAPTKRGIFDGLVIYINGSTHPLISDHKLKHMLAENGAKLSIHLGRRQVTHVVLGRPGGPPNEACGAGGGLSGTKIQKEIQRVRGCGVKYVGVEWVLESMKQGKRLSEASFSNLKLAAKGQKSVYSMFKK